MTHLRSLYDLGYVPSKTQIGDSVKQVDAHDILRWFAVVIFPDSFTKESVISLKAPELIEQFCLVR